MMKSYKPLIATSLALALSVSVASGADNCPSGNTSAICYSTTNGTDFKQFTSLTIAPTGQGSNQFNQLKYTAAPAQGITISDFTLKFRNNGGEGQQSSSEASIGGQNAQLKLINKGNGLQLGSAGTSTLAVDFGKYEAQNFARKATLSFEGTTPNTAGSTPKTALKGNIEIKAGNSTNDEVIATFKGDMKGNIKIVGQSIGYRRVAAKAKTNFTFENGASLKGNLRVEYVEGGQNFTFERGGIEGSIKTSAALDIANIDATMGGTTTTNITFKGEGFIKKGTGADDNIILAEGAKSADIPQQYHAHNRILFEGNGKIGENETSRVSIIARPRWTRGHYFSGAQSYNLIQFKGQATLFLDKLQIENYTGAERLNIISLEGGTNGDLNINTIEVRSPSGRNYIGKGLLKFANGANSGQETAKDLVIDDTKINEATFKGNNYNAIKTLAQTLRANGTLTAEAIKTAAEGGGINGIFIDTLNVTGADGIKSWNTQRNIISTENLRVDQKVYADQWNRNKGTNIIFADSLTIGGGVLANGGSNYIYGTNTSAGTNTINTSITAQGDTGSNQLNLRGNTTRIGAAGSKVSMTATSGSSSNYLFLNSTTNNEIYLSDLSVNASSGNNILSFENTSANNRLEVNNISSSNGGNYIGKGLLGENSAGVLTPILNLSSGNVAMGTFQASNISTNTNDSAKNIIYFQNITIKGNVTASNGQNIINSKDNLAITGNITANFGGASANKINFVGTTTALTGMIKAESNNSRNLLRFAGTTSNTLTLTGLQAITGTDNQVYNILSFDGTGTNALNITGAVSANNSGRNYIGKGLLGEGASANDLNADGIPGFDFTNADNALVGTLTIRGGVLASETGLNSISFKAASTQTEAVISSTDNAISGNANIYLDLSNAQLTDWAIDGNIAGGGTKNIKIVSTTHKGGLDGNITNTQGNTTNVILENVLWNPVATPARPKGASSFAIGDENPNSGVLTNNGGNVNLVLRTTAQALGNVTTIPLFNIISGKNSITNIVIQGSQTSKVNTAETAVGANIDYANGGIINLIFASKSTNADSFASGSTDIEQNKVLGSTYSNGVKLTLQDKIIDTYDRVEGLGKKSILEHYADKFKRPGYESHNVTIATIRTEQTDTVSVNGLAVGDISSLGNTQSKVYDVVLGGKSAFVGGISLAQGSNIALTMNSGSALIANVTDDQGNAIKSLSLETLNLKKIAGSETYYRQDAVKHPFDQRNIVIDLVTGGNAFDTINFDGTSFNLMTIGNKDNPSNGGLKGDTSALFTILVNPNADQSTATLGGQASSGGTGTYGNIYSGRVIVYGGDNNQTQYIRAFYKQGSSAASIGYKGGGTEIAGNIAVATVAATSNITFEGSTQIQGYDVVGTTLTEGITTGLNGGSDGDGYKTYFIKSVNPRGASQANQQAGATALSSNYALYLANFNSLNKRMGDLRNNPNNQGGWARIFNGMETTEFALKMQTIYTTIQAGYDYDFDLENAKNYTGIALSYANSIADKVGGKDIDGFDKGISSVTSNAIELALYNAYVQNGGSSDNGYANGLYADSIVKFSYILSNIKMLGDGKSYDTNNWAVTLSQEVGYRFILGNDKEWYIDPQAELGFGYFNETNMRQTLGQAYLDSKQGNIFTIRGRAGASYGYKFDKFTEGKGFKASAYVGTYFVYDYLNGGQIAFTTDLQKTNYLTALTSTMRGVINVGTNFEVKDNTRIYLDFERSFGGKITTDYQVNLGARYSFGEKTSDESMKVENAAPLKVENTPAEETEKAQIVPTTSEKVKEDTGTKATKK
ncbi:hypothetical protein BBW65_02015 [Helicobacter enhydrae]|uniref:Autotransporter domain-containing protein n=1 Tax=Helicobacter enhydrae TaxID=222136 RepID=A0A1B1U4N2_9HELI|nr:autotransporter outer membrane beta-barrel domain-containing protein [Helicobacter enhydrae]ANV97655.1 hypothetical protein BBW65_02015 [Helicobacter enhydrae]